MKRSPRVCGWLALAGMIGWAISAFAQTTPPPEHFGTYLNNQNVATLPFAAGDNIPVVQGGITNRVSATSLSTALGVMQTNAANATLPAALNNLGIGPTSTPTFAGATLTTPLPISSGGTGATTALAAATALSAMTTNASNAVLPGALNNLGLGTTNIPAFAGVTLSPVASSIAEGFNITQSGSGSSPGNDCGPILVGWSANCIHVTSDSVQPATGNTRHVLTLYHTINGGNGTGNPDAFGAITEVTSIPSTVTSGAFYGGAVIAGIGDIASGGTIGTNFFSDSHGKGNIFGNNVYALLSQGTATGWKAMEGEEIDVEANTGSSVEARVGLNIVSGPANSTVQGSLIDAALVIDRGGAASGVGWKTGIQFGYLNENNQSPISAGGYIITTSTGVATALDTGIDISGTWQSGAGYTYTGNFFKGSSTNFWSGAGKINAVSSNGGHYFARSDGGSTLTVESAGSHSASIILNNQVAGQQDVFSFLDGGTTKWQWGKQTSNSFFGFDVVNAKDFFDVTTAGVTTVGETSSTSNSLRGGWTATSGLDNTPLGATTPSTGAFTTLSTTGALTYGGVTLSNSVQGTGSMVLSTSPTITTPTLSGTVNATLITGLGAPTNPGDAVNKTYADAISSGISIHASAAAATTANLTATFAHVDSGVGSTLTNSGAQAAFATDGYSASLNDRILVAFQTTTANNGIYTVTTVGDGATNWVLTRATDFNTAAAGNIAQGASVIIVNGTLYGKTQWVETGPGPFTVDTTAIVFSETVAASNGSVNSGTINQFGYYAAAGTAISGISITGLVLGKGASAPAAYSGTSCTNQFPRSLNANGVATCATVGTSDLASSLSLTTPTLGVASATTINKWTFTAPATAATLAAGADNVVYTGPAASATLMANDYSNGVTLGAANAFLTSNTTGIPNAVVITGLVLGNGASAPTAYAGTSSAGNVLTALNANGVGTFLAYGLTGNSTLVETTAGGLLTASLLPAATSSTIGGVIVGTGLTVSSGTVTPTFGTATNQIAEGGVITAGGPTGSATVVPIITYNAAGQLTTVTTATIAPAVGSVTGLGTGVATALGVNIGTAGAFVVNGGALGTPSSGVATNLTGTASGLVAGTVTTNANLTGPVTSSGNATAFATMTANAFLTGNGTALPNQVALTGIVKGNGASAPTAVTAPAGTIVGTTDTQTLTNKTLTDYIDQEAHTNTAYTITGSTTLATIGGFDQTFTASAHYSCQGHIHFTTLPTSSNGFKVALVSDGTSSVTALQFTADARNAAALVTSGFGTATALGSTAIAPTAAMTDIFLSASMQVNAGGVIHVQGAESTSSGTVAFTADKARWECHRSS
jgi:hypothetical protein